MRNLPAGRDALRSLLRFSRAVDSVTARLGRSVAWLVVAAAVVSAGNAVIRKVFETSSNAWLELQWWLFGAVFLLAAPWTLAVNEHIRIDIVNARLSRGARDAIELIGLALFLLPMCALIAIESWPFFLRSAPQAAELAAWWAGFDASAPLTSLSRLASLGEQSSNAGGLPQWPAKALIPIAFALLFLQGLSELVKRLAIMAGEMDEPRHAGGFHDMAAARTEADDKPD